MKTNIENDITKNPDEVTVVLENFMVVHVPVNVMRFEAVNVVFLADASSKCFFVDKLKVSFPLSEARMTGPAEKYSSEELLSAIKTYGLTQVEFKDTFVTEWPDEDTKFDSRETVSYDKNGHITITVF